MITKQEKKRLRERRDVLKAAYQALLIKRDSVPPSDYLQALIELKQMYNKFEEELLQIAEKEIISKN